MSSASQPPCASPDPRGSARAGLRDSFGRVIDYLRVSLTDACNLRCVYCLPENARFQPRDMLLTDEELLRLLTLFARAGFRKVRFTGGEPTLRSSLVEIVAATSRLPGVETVGLTTNGLLLAAQAAALKAAGLTSVNVSIDSLDQDRFGRITRRGNLPAVLAGVEAARVAGLRIKINCVVCRGLNDGDDVLELARLTLREPWQVRFIEEMPFKKSSHPSALQPVTEAEIVAHLEQVFGKLELLNQGCLEGEARIFRLRAGQGTVGFISPVSRPFCGDCNRLRLTADGVLRTCLLRDEEIHLRMLLRSGATDEMLLEQIRHAVEIKPWGHGLPDQIYPANRTMAEIGG